jgi:hypothetical protein
VSLDVHESTSRWETDFSVPCRARFEVEEVRKAKRIREETSTRMKLLRNQAEGKETASSMGTVKIDLVAEG